MSTPTHHIPVILCIVLGVLAHKTIHNIHYAPFINIYDIMSPGAKKLVKFCRASRNNVTSKETTKQIQKNESNYQRHTGEHNNKSNNQHRRKIIAQLSPQRQIFYNLHDMRHIHCNNCLYRHNIKTAQNRPSPTKPPCSAHFPTSQHPKSTKNGGNPPFSKHQTTQITVIFAQLLPLL